MSKNKSVQVYFFHPLKQVPTWFQTLKGTKNPSIKFVSVGFIVNRKNTYHVYPLTDPCLHIDGNGGDIELHGGGDGVYMHVSFFDRITRFLR